MLLFFPVWAMADDVEESLLEYFNPGRLSAFEERYGPEGRERLEDLKAWVLEERRTERPVRERLDVVNRYFNQFEFVDDIDHWGVDDYWATPLETVASGGGDCEDFVIAKYMALSVLGIDVAHLRLMYAKAVELNQAHMVLLYTNTPGDMPLVLDNLIDAIKPGNRRPDLVPVYSFNAKGLWKARTFDNDIRLKVGESGVDLWGELMERLAEEAKG
ncbi:transglutaminase-like cysteine peptidase [Ferrimonas marina]|uniref:transglutaminase-like cysteine peptidase n=1 Tax=Ferrimonas marina TaxID=299255 RepID=UPI00190EB167|nr:transglutaminase-like cysteine peptidase [Ferrimonas marina]